MQGLFRRIGRRLGIRTIADPAEVGADIKPRTPEEGSFLARTREVLAEIKKGGRPNIDTRMYYEALHEVLGDTAIPMTEKTGMIARLQQAMGGPVSNTPSVPTFTNLYDGMKWIDQNHRALDTMSETNIKGLLYPQKTRGKGTGRAIPAKKLKAVNTLEYELLKTRRINPDYLRLVRQAAGAVPGAAVQAGPLNKYLNYLRHIAKGDIHYPLIGFKMSDIPTYTEAEAKGLRFKGAYLRPDGTLSPPRKGTWDAVTAWLGSPENMLRGITPAGHIARGGMSLHNLYEDRSELMATIQHEWLVRRFTGLYSKHGLDPMDHTLNERLYKTMNTLGNEAGKFKGYRLPGAVEQGILASQGTSSSERAFLNDFKALMKDHHTEYRLATGTKGEINYYAPSNSPHVTGKGGWNDVFNPGADVQTLNLLRDMSYSYAKTREGQASLVGDFYAEMTNYFVKAARKVAFQPVLAQLARLGDFDKAVQRKYRGSSLEGERTGMFSEAQRRVLERFAMSVKGVSGAMDPKGRLAQMDAWLNEGLHAKLIGFNLGTGIKNLTQNAFTAATIGPQWLARALMDPEAGMFSASGKRMIGESGVAVQYLHPDVQRNIAGSSRNPYIRAYGKVSQAGKTYFMGITEYINRGAAFTAGYLKAKAQGKAMDIRWMPEDSQMHAQWLWKNGRMEDAAKFIGKQLNNFTQYNYSRTHLPQLLTGAGPKTLWALSTYPLSYMNMMASAAARDPKTALFLGLATAGIPLAAMQTFGWDLGRSLGLGQVAVPGFGPFVDMGAQVTNTAFTELQNFLLEQEIAAEERGDTTFASGMQKARSMVPWGKAGRGEARRQALAATQSFTYTPTWTTGGKRANMPYKVAASILGQAPGGRMFRDVHRFLETRSKGWTFTQPETGHARFTPTGGATVGTEIGRMLGLYPAEQRIQQLTMSKEAYMGEARQEERASVARQIIEAEPGMKWELARGALSMETAPKFGSLKLFKDETDLASVLRNESLQLTTDPLTLSRSRLAHPQKVRMQVFYVRQWLRASQQGQGQADAAMREAINSGVFAKGGKLFDIDAFSGAVKDVVAYQEAQGRE